MDFSLVESVSKTKKNLVVANRSQLRSLTSALAARLPHIPKGRDLDSYPRATMTGQMACYPETEGWGLLFLATPE